MCMLPVRLHLVIVGAMLTLHAHSCNRLGLVPIAYLWERDQEELLHEMISAGMESILLKVAGAGYVVHSQTCYSNHFLCCH